MSDETDRIDSGVVVIKSGKTLGGGEVDIVDPGLVPTFVDVMTEYRQQGGVIYLTLGCTATDAANKGEVILTNRLRMSVVTAQSLRDLLANLVNDALKPIDKSQAN